MGLPSGPRLEALTAGASVYVGDKPCKRGHYVRFSSNGGCVDCKKLRRSEKKGELAAKQRQWRAENSSHRRAYQSEFYERNKDKWRVYEQNRRCAETSDRLSTDITRRLLVAQRGRCACCSEKLVSPYHLDHVLPLSRGGRNVDSNMQLLNAICNLQKHAKHPVDFMQERGFLL